MKMGLLFPECDAYQLVGLWRWFCESVGNNFQSENLEKNPWLVGGYRAYDVDSVAVRAFLWSDWNH